MFTLEVNDFENAARNSISIFNLVGAEVQRAEINEPIQTVNISGLPAGVYVLKLLLGDRIGFKKLVKN
jgi:hypothetical protein